MDFCPKCGFELKRDVAVADVADLKFCPKCGKDLKGFGTADSVQDLDNRVLELLQRNQYINAIRLARQETGKGLKEGKEYVDKIAARSNVQAVAPASRKGGFITYLIVAGFLGLMISSVGIAVFPQIGYVAKPFLCDGELIFESHEMYTPPGQAGYTTGVSRSFRCADGSDRSMAVFIVSTLIYTAILMVLLYLRRMFKIMRGTIE